MSRAQELAALADTVFDEPPLNEDEVRLLETIARGNIAPYKSQINDIKHPVNTISWGEGGAVRAELIRWLCVDQRARKSIPPQGIHICGAKLLGRLDLAFVSVPCPIFLHKCVIPEGIDLTSAETRLLDFCGSYSGPIIGDGLIAHSSIILREGFQIKGIVQFRGAIIKGNLYCGGHFLSDKGNALLLDQAKIGGSVCLDGHFRAEGTVGLQGTSIDGELRCTNGQFINPHGEALVGDGMQVGLSVSFNGNFLAEGTVQLHQARLGGDLRCTKGRFLCLKGSLDALAANGITVSGSIFFNENFWAVGTVRLRGARLGGDLRCTKGHFLGLDKEPSALAAPGIVVGGSVYFDGDFRALGEVSLFRATITGNLGCRKGLFLNQIGRALHASGINVSRNVFFDEGFMALGEVRLRGARITGDLTCNQGWFLNPEKEALHANWMTIVGDAFFNKGFHAQGMIALRGSTISGSLSFNEVRFCGAGQNGLNAENARITGAFVWKNITPSTITLNLSHAIVGQFLDDQASWPESGQLSLDGFSYNPRFAYFFQGFENFNVLNFKHLGDPVDLWES